MNRPIHPRTRRRRGFTLLEIMVATTIATVALSVGVGALISSSRMVYDSSRRLELNSKIRMFTDRFAKDTIDANAYFVMTSYASLDGSADLIGADEDSAEINKPLASGLSGDCVVLEYRDDPDRRSAITRLRVYFRDTLDADAGAPIRYLEVAIPEADQTLSLNELVNDHVNLSDNRGSHPTLVSYNVSGIIPSDGSEVKPIFFNHNDRAVSVNFRMETEGTDNGPARRSASAYNFTISPRR